MAVSLLEFEKALATLKEALESLTEAQSHHNLTQYRLVRDALIQRYEFSIELAWKISAKILGSSSTTAKPVLREMVQNGLIGDIQTWFDFIEGRNKTSHAYDEGIAEEVVLLVQKFYPEATQLLAKLKKL